MGEVGANRGDEVGANRGDEDEQLSRFLARFPNKVYFEPGDLDPDKQRVFFTLIEGMPQPQSDISSSSSSSAYLSASLRYFHEYIKSAFMQFNRCPHKGLLVQFWSPRNITGRWTLLTSDEPFVLDHLDPRHWEYRLWCIDENNVSDHDSQPAYDPISTAFPDAIVVLERIGRCPLVDKALECGFSSQIMMPVYCETPCKTRRVCVGVIECCLDMSCVLEVFMELRRAVESVGLYMHREGSRRPEPNPRLEAAKCEIKEALQMVCEANHLDLAQVWIPYDVEHFPQPDFYFPKEEEEKNPQLKLGKFMAKLCGYRFDDFNVGFSSLVMDYCDSSDVLPYHVGIGFVGKTLLTYEPRFCKNFGKLTDIESYDILTLLSVRTHCSSLVICLRSNYTGKDVDYAFEFLWPNTRNHLDVLKNLLLTLKSCLPSFTFASGARLDDELWVEDVENITGCPDRLIKIFEQPKALDKAALDSGGKGVKRKLDELAETEGEVQNVACADRYGEEEDDIIILATYNYEFITKPSYTLANVEDKIEKEFKLDPGSYTLKYEIEGETGTLTTDQDLTSCIELLRSGQKSRILLRVERK